MDRFYPIPTCRICLVALAVFIIVGLAGRSASACEGGAGGPWPDAGFGDNGHALLQFETDGERGDFGNALAVQTDGRILIAGFTVLSDRRDGAVLRLLPDGNIDTSFGIQGRRLLGIASEDGFAQITDMQLQSDGRKKFRDRHCLEWALFGMQPMRNCSKGPNAAPAKLAC